jgi:hypothetical protein
LHNIIKGGGDGMQVVVVFLERCKKRRWKKVWKVLIKKKLKKIKEN